MYVTNDPDSSAHHSSRLGSEVKMTEGKSQSNKSVQGDDTDHERRNLVRDQGEEACTLNGYYIDEDQK